MDKYYGNVCELDIIFNFQKAYFILDELLLAGEMQESSKKNVLRVIGAQDSLEEMEVSDAGVPLPPPGLVSSSLVHPLHLHCMMTHILYHHPLIPCPVRSRTMLLQGLAECIEYLSCVSLVVARPHLLMSTLTP